MSTFDTSDSHYVADQQVEALIRHRLGLDEARGVLGKRGSGVTTDSLVSACRVAMQFPADCPTRLLVRAETGMHSAHHAASLRMMLAKLGRVDLRVHAARPERRLLGQSAIVLDIA